MFPESHRALWPTLVCLDMSMFRLKQQLPCLFCGCYGAPVLILIYFHWVGLLMAVFVAEGEEVASVNMVKFCLLSLQNINGRSDPLSCQSISRDNFLILSLLLHRWWMSRKRDLISCGKFWIHWVDFTVTIYTLNGRGKGQTVGL